MPPDNPNWLGDAARFPAVIQQLGKKRVGSLPTVEDNLAARWIGYCYGPSKLIEAAELIVRCSDCRGKPIMAVNFVDNYPLLLALERGDRLDATKPGKRSWQFSWLNQGSVAHVRCNHRFVIDLAALRRVTPKRGRARHTEILSHLTTGGIVR